jgi:hypothetical protein
VTETYTELTLLWNRVPRGSYASEESYNYLASMYFIYFVFVIRIYLPICLFFVYFTTLPIGLLQTIGLLHRTTGWFMNIELEMMQIGGRGLIWTNVWVSAWENWANPRRVSEYFSGLMEEIWIRTSRVWNSRALHSSGTSTLSSLSNLTKYRLSDVARRLALVAHRSPITSVSSEGHRVWMYCKIYDG